MAGSLTETLAVWGAVTGTTATLVSLMGAWRDRPRISVNGGWNMAINASALSSALDEGSNEEVRFDVTLSVQVANLGRQPVTLFLVGFALSSRKIWRRRWPFRVEVPGDSLPWQAARGSAETPIMLAPGQEVEFLSDIDPDWIADYPANLQHLRAWVNDVRFRMTWGDRLPRAELEQALAPIA
jgi:hypothetical protein